MQALAFNVDTTDRVRLTYQEEVEDNDISLQFHTLNNNNPKEQGDIIAFYESDGSGNVKPTAKPLKITIVNRPLCDSNIIIEDVPRAQRDYVFAYIQGSSEAELKTKTFSETKVSSLLTLPKNATQGSTFSIELNIASKGDLVILNYIGIPNTEPKNKAWIGIWKNKNLNLTTPPDFFYPIEDTGATGKMRIDDLLVNTEYFLAYFVDGYNATKTALVTNHLAAFIQFKTIFGRETE